MSTRVSSMVINQYKNLACLLNTRLKNSPGNINIISYAKAAVLCLQLSFVRVFS